MLVVTWIMKNGLCSRMRMFVLSRFTLGQLLEWHVCMTSLVMIRVFLFSYFFLFGFYNYMHVGCTMHNEEWHLVFCMFYPNVQLAIGCNSVFRKWEWGHTWGAIMVDLLVINNIDCVHDDFDAELAPTCQTTLLCWVYHSFY